ncbi:hypothetical protein Psefu_0218 [Pseudomonas fulva 12-X]|jgi:hypothetical protein|uniref:Uncharacterized protein n=1 Tax=Pseudomonas fulva (strain 12-X) TaxID=743720 RepID=F6AEC8_PSEF1|nr:hypothetical protein Psefu_0218 [Pseudomonas fulva 12-X]
MRDACETNSHLMDAFSTEMSERQKRQSPHMAGFVLRFPVT